MQKEWWEHPKASEGWLDDGAGPEAAGTVPSCPGTWSGSAWSCHRAEATVPRCGWETSTALGTSSRACQSTKHVQGHQVMPRAWGCWEVPQELILCASAPLSLCQSNTASPGAQAGAAKGEMEPAGERGAPHIPQSSSHVPCTILPDWALQSWEEPGTKCFTRGRRGKKQEEIPGGCFSMAISRLAAAAQHCPAPLCLLHTSRAPRGAARDPPPAGDTKVAWSDWESLRVKGQLAQLGCWSTGTAAPAALLPSAKRGARVQVRGPLPARGSAELSLPPGMPGRCDSR